MRLALLGIGAAAMTIVTPVTAQESIPANPAASLAAPRYEWKSTPLMVTGIALTSFGALSVIGGGITAGVGMMTNGCRWGGNDCQSGSDIRLALIGFGILVGGGGLGLGVGIPLWYRGAQRIPIAQDGTGTAATAPILLIGPRAAGLRWTF